MGGAIELSTFAEDDDLDEEEGEAELAGLLSRSRLGVAPRHAAVGRRSQDNNQQSSSVRNLTLSLLALAPAIFLAHRYFSTRDNQDDELPFAPPVGHKSSKADKSSSICPSTVETSNNDKNADDFDLYVKDAIAHQNKSLKDFKSMNLDGWGIPFNEVKDLLRPWKAEVFANNIQSGDSIYESAMGIGMNLFISAEVLKEEHNITNISISGNDYLGEAIEIANSVWEEEEAQRLANKDFFCQADSTKLDFIPNESFDFVFSGYIDPITDPLDRWPSNMTAEEKWEKGVELCKSTNKKDKKITEQAQKVQNDWFASWVKELVRIAKPGKVIAVENGAESLCTNLDDWGGVDKTWWRDAIDEYGLKVDPDSLLIRDEKPKGNWLATRYHVMMRKSRVCKLYGNK